MSTTLYTQVNCGFRQVVEILNILNGAFDGLLGKIPSHNTIEDWVKKCGLEVYEKAGEALRNTKYAQIVDESMMIGSEKLLLTLGVPAEHQGRPLNYYDINILNIAVSESWNGEKIGAQLKAATEKVGHEPLYIISDNASVMNKGIRCSGIPHRRDISHSLGMLLERIYKNEADFKEYLKLMTEPKFKYNMKKIAYLLPPTQRTVARFINLSEWVKWSTKMLNIYNRLSKDEQKVFSFVPLNASLIDELSEALTCVNSIESICKTKGFSKETVKECKLTVKKHLFCGNSRMIQLGESIFAFLTEEAKAIKANIVQNNSSDIIESVFGKYKARKSFNKLNGVTPFILFIPICAKLSSEPHRKRHDFKGALENKTMNHLEDWKKVHLTQNLAQLRTYCLRKSA
ncbi:MAG: hypothetical protein ABIV51_09900 [Saprospiraceae bacterium]